MKIIKLVASALCTSVVVAGVGVLAPAAALADGTVPPWQTGTGTGNNAKDAGNLGVVGFYDSSGTQITSGDATTPIPFLRADTGTFPTSGTAQVQLCTPDANNPESNWSCNPLSAGNNYGGALPTGLPGNKPTVKSDLANDDTLDDYVQNESPAVTPPTGFTDVYEYRVYNVGTGPSQYASADVKYNPSAHSWTQVFPTVTTTGTATSVALAATKTGTQLPGTSETLTATISPSGVTGTVQFEDHSTSAIGTPVTVVSDKASTTFNLTAGSHAFTAVFTPTGADATTYSGSTSDPLVVTSNQVTTSISLAASATSVSVGSPLTLTATETPAVAGAVQFYDGSATTGVPVPATSGVAMTTFTPTPGSHDYTAIFTPTNATAYTGSSSSDVTVSVSAISTTTVLSISGPGPVTAGTSESLSVVVSPAVAGTVLFKDGAAGLGSAVAVDGSGHASLTGVPAVGTHSFTATFTPTDQSSYAGSTSNVVPLTVAKATGTLTLTVTPASTAYGTTASASVSITAPGLSPSGTVSITAGSTALGTATLVGGAATVALPTTALKAGTVTLTVTYSGDANVSSGTATTTLILTKGKVTIATKFAKSTVTKSKKATLAVSVKGSGFVGTGKVQVFKGKKALVSATLNKLGKATLTLPRLPDGKYKLTVKYVGSSSIAASSTTVKLTVKN